MDLLAIERALKVARLRGNSEALTAELLHQGWIPPADVSDHPPRKRAGREEARLGRALQQLGLSVIQQYPISANASFYNNYFVDLVCGGVAIEVESSQGPEFVYSLRERAEVLISQGWSVLYLLIGKKDDFSDHVPELLARYLEEMELGDRDPYAAFSARGHHVEVGGLDNRGRLVIKKPLEPFRLPKDDSGSQPPAKQGTPGGTPRPKMIGTPEQFNAIEPGVRHRIIDFAEDRDKNPPPGRPNCI